MSQADELLELLSNDGVTALSADPSVEPHIVIDSSRNITVPGQLKRIAVQYDHNIETVTFDCPRYWDGHDMSTMIVYINYKRPDGKVGSYIANNVKIDDIDDSIIHFDWTISNYCTMVSGSLMFLVCIKRTNSDGEEINHWNSELNTEMYVSKGLETENLVEESYPDVITQLLERMDVVEDAAGPIAENTALAAASADTAVKKAAEASTSASNAKTSESNAATSASTASAKAAEASESATNASTSELNAENSALLAQSWATGGTGLREDEATNNAKYWSTVAKDIAGGDFATKTEAQNYATTAETNAKSYADGLITDGDFSSKAEAQEYATTAENNAKAYADSLAAEDIDCGTW